MKVIIGSISTSILLIIGLLTGGIAMAAPSTLYVSKSKCSVSGPGTSVSPYCTIQEAVNAAPSGATIQVENGTFTGQVLISGSSKNNITINGYGSSTVIAAPTTMTSPKAVVEVSQATGITLSDLTVSGPGGSGCDSLEYGVRVDSGGSTTVSDSTVTKIEDSPFSGCQNGIAVQAGSTDNNTTTTGNVTVSDSTITKYQKDGIKAVNTGSNAIVSNDTITGAGATPTIAQNAIEIISGATATISDNTVKDNIYSPGTNASTGVLLYDSGIVKLTDNVVNHNDVDIYGLGLQGSTVTDNIANNATFNGIYVDPGSSGNTFTDNSAQGTTGSGNYDIEDDSTGTGTLGTANTWHNNSCKTSSPAKLCKQ